MTRWREPEPRRKRKLRLLSSESRPASPTPPSQTASSPVHTAHLAGQPSNELDTHPISPTVSQSKDYKKTKTTWDAYSRYFSERTSSFPDYGAPKVAMKGLKRLNASSGGPVNTMSGQPNKSPLASQATSRPKRSRDSPSSSNIVEISPEKTTPLRRYGGSDSGTRIPPPLFCRASEGVTQTYSLRDAKRSRPSCLVSAGRPRKLERGLTIESDDDSAANLHSRQRQASASTDVITVDDLAEDDPPPANVRSDLTGIKRPRPGSLLSQRQERKAKRPKGGSSDELDELQIVHKRARKMEARGSDSVESLNAQSYPSSRADIKSSYFTTPPPQDVQTKAVNFAVKRAAAGKHYYVSDEDQRGQVFLRDTPGSPWLLSAVDRNDKILHDLAWMDIDFGRIQNLFYSDSSFVEVRRPSTKRHPSLLVFQFDSSDDAQHLLNHRHIDKDRADKKDSITLKNVFKTTMKDARNCHREGNNKDQEAFRSTPQSPQRIAFRRRSVSPQPVSGVSTQRQKDLLRSVNEKHSSPSNSQRYTRSTSEQHPVDPVALQSRRTRRSAPALLLDDEVSRWTVLNPDWAKNWRQSLVWPPTGKNRTTVDKDDVPRLDEGEFLNDNLINFWIRHLQHKLEAENPAMLRRVYFFSTFFFEKLSSNQGRIDYNGVRTWTSKVDVFSYDYLVVPVNENAHWYLAIVCNPGKLLPQETEQKVAASSPIPEKVANLRDRLSEVCLADDHAQGNDPKAHGQRRSRTTQQQDETVSSGTHAGSKVKAQQDPNKPRIITLDSLGSAHPKTCSALRLYLMAEAKDKKYVENSAYPAGLTAKSIPQQDNWCDCGIYVLAYVEQFLSDPDESVRRILQKEPTHWKVVAPEQRKSIRQLILKLQGRQQQDAERERAEKQARRRDKLRAKKAENHEEPVKQLKRQVGSDVAPTPACELPALADDHPIPKASSESKGGASSPSPARSLRIAQSAASENASLRTSSERNCSKNASPSESFHTARSSPAVVDSRESATPKLSSGLRTSDLVASLDGLSPEEEGEVVLIDELPSSPRDVNLDKKASINDQRKRKRSPDSKTSPQSSTRRRQFADQLADLHFGLRESIEVEENDETQAETSVTYDGIDRGGQTD